MLYSKVTLLLFFSFQKTAKSPAITNVLPLHNETTSFTFSAQNFFWCTHHFTKSVGGITKSKRRYEKLEVHFDFVTCILNRNTWSCLRERRLKGNFSQYTTLWRKGLIEQILLDSWWEITQYFPTWLKDNVLWAWLFPGLWFLLVQS